MRKNIKIGDKIIYAEFKYNDRNEIKQRYEKVKILGINENFIVLNDLLFTKLSNCETFDNCYTKLNHAKCYKSQIISSYPKEIICVLYSTSKSLKINENRIKSALEIFLKKESWFLSCKNIINLVNFKLKD
jgi:predicted amino acid racemase